MTSQGLIARQLTRRFGERIAVEDVSFELVPGEIFALLGPNGAGKTTTLRMLAGLIAPTQGTVYVLGEALTPATAVRLRSHIGFLTESPGLWDTLTVRQNLCVYARLYGLSAPVNAVDEALALFDISDRGDDRTARLSKGLKQRVALARALLHKPQIVLLDEPTSGLDPENARAVRELILRLRNERHSVLLCTHNLDEVERVADRVAVLRSRLVATGTPAELRQRLFAPRLRIRLADAAEKYAAVVRSRGLADVHVDGDEMQISATTVGTPELVRLLVDAGAGIELIEREEPSLEDVYLKLLHGNGRQ